MKCFVLYLVMLVAISANPIYAAPIISTFEVDDEGWTLPDGGGTLTHLGSGGNPGGHLTLEDTLGGALTTHAPAKFLGGLSSFDGGTLSFDAILLETNGETELPDFGLVRISSSSDTASLDLVTGLTESWATYSTPFTAAAWGESQVAWDSILSDVIEISVVVDPLQDTGDIMGFDNFAITASAAPEPSTLILLAAGTLGFIGIGYRQRKKSVEI